MFRNKTLQVDKRARIKLRSGGRYRVKIRRVMLAVIMTAVLAVPAVASAAAMEVTIPYQQTFTNDSAEASVADTFVYQLTPADASTPVPEECTDGVYEFSLTGNTSGSLNLNISFPKPGYYYYTVRSKVNSPAAGYTYNTKTYTIMVMVTNGSAGLENSAITIQDADKNKYSSLLFETKYYRARPGGGDAGGGGAGGNAAAAGGAGAAAAPGPAPANNPGPGTDGPPTTINDPEPPLAGVDEDYWALVNLICMLLTWLTALAAGVFYLKRRREADDDEAAAEAEESEDPQKLRRKGWLRIIAVLAAIVSLIAFILTEDMTLPMRLVDEWTIWMIIFLAAALLLALISRKVTEETEETEATPEG